MGDPIDLAGTVALVTGGTRGIGAGIAARFVELGAAVTVCGRTEPVSPAPGTTFMVCDVRDDEQVDAVVAAVVDRSGRLDVVVNNAGGAPPANSATASPRFSTAVITLNLVAPLIVAQRANAQMQQQDDGGTIINITSVSGMRPS